MGWFAIGIYHPKREVNIGSLWRSAYIYGAAYVFTIGRRYEPQASDTTNTDRHIPLWEYQTFEEFYNKRPFATKLVAVEQYGTPVKDFQHPERAIYLLGAEDTGLPQNILARCDSYIEIPTPRKISLNVANAGTVIMDHRINGR